MLLGIFAIFVNMHTLLVKVLNNGYGNIRGLIQQVEIEDNLILPDMLITNE